MHTVLRNRDHPDRWGVVYVSADGVVLNTVHEFDDKQTAIELASYMNGGGQPDWWDNSPEEEGEGSDGEATSSSAEDGA